MKEEQQQQKKKIINNQKTKEFQDSIKKKERKIGSKIKK